MPISNPVHASPTIGARVRHSLNQSVAHNVGTALAFNSERADSDTLHDNAANNSRLTCKTQGAYLIGGTVFFESHATGVRQLSILLNGTATIAVQRIPAVNNDSLLTIATAYPLLVNDYVQLIAYQNSGVALSVVSSGNFSPEFYLHQL